MCDADDEEPNCSQVESDQTDDRLSLLDLPVEIILHICSFLDASTLVHGLGLVCKYFHRILNDDSLWKVRISQIWPNSAYPVLPPAEDDDLFWKLSCVAIEKQASLWREEGSMTKLSIDNFHDTTVDSLLLMHGGSICISGARDRSLVCWKLPPEENTQAKFMCVHQAHEGWISDLAAIGDTIYSCSWDRSTKGWTLTSTGLVHFQTYEMMGVSGALLCVASCPELDVFATGSFCKSVLVFDSRVGRYPISKYHSHKGAIIRLAMSSQFILSASEDGTVCIWDQRAGKTLKSITISRQSFPMSLSLQRDIVYVGDSHAKLHVLDPKKDFQPVKCFTTEHRKGITGVHLAPGCLITSSMDETVKISSPTDPPRYLTTLESGNGEIASIDYLNGVLAISGNGIDIWRPRSTIRYA